jgi:16S rRNA (cytosine967-C5)-methyltransferase
MSQTQASANVRANIALALNMIIESNRTIDWLMENRPKWTSTSLERELLYGCVRHYFFLHELVSRYLDKPLRAKDLDLLHLLLVGAYQLQELSIPAHAVINETVNATKKLGKPWARGLVNGVLRNIDRHKDELHKLERSFDQPLWLTARVNSDYGAQAQTVLASSYQRAPMSLRINQTKINPQSYQQKLSSLDIAFKAGFFPESVVLDVPIPSAQLPGWTAGEVAVQDMGAQFAAHLLHDNAPQTPTAHSTRKILDACAAPGGKLAHLLELSAVHNTPVAVTAIDSNSTRLAGTREILTRLGHKPKMLQGDATTLQWWDGEAFDQILLDAPCSGTGTLRRHPDIRLLITEAGLQQNIKLQQQIINNLWQTLAPGGNLLYCTCSLLAAENDGVVAHFLDRSQDAIVKDIQLPSGEKTQFGWQLLPTDPLTDGFYYSLIEKKV